MRKSLASLRTNLISANVVSRTSLETYVSALLLDVFYSIVVKWKAFENIFLLKHSTARHDILRRESQTQKCTCCQKEPIKPLWKDTLLKSP